MSLKIGGRLSNHPIFTPQIRQFLLHNFWRHVDHVIFIVWLPNLTQSITLHPHYKSPITHQSTPSFHCYRRSSLGGCKFVVTKLSMNGWCYKQQKLMLWRCGPTPTMVKEGGTRWKWSCNRWKDVFSCCKMLMLNRVGWMIVIMHSRHYKTPRIAVWTWCIWC
jgi:hypothetical protein